MARSQQQQQQRHSSRFSYILLAILGILASQALASPALEKRASTCPGIPGYCSEAYPGDTCLVVCAFGRNNVPECQADGTWTDIPRCIEHEPGIPEQVPGICPGIPGYCSLDSAGAVCEFDCVTGPDIRSFCTPDGTWDPYPTCEGDVRETRDGCDPCPGPFGGPRNRTLEAKGGGNNAGRNNNRGRPKQPQQPARPAFQQQQQQQRGATVIQPTRETNFASVNKRPQNNRNNRNNNQNNRNNNQNKRNNNQNNRNNRNNNQNNRDNNQFHNKSGARPSNNRHQQNNRNQGFANSNQNNRRNQQQFQGSNQGAHRNNNGRPNNRNNNFIPQAPPRQQQQQQHSSSSSGRCPGNSLEVCIDVCPSFSARVFGACVAGCARRCPSKK